MSEECPDCARVEKAEPDFETYEISADGRAITCKRCKMTSFNPTDVEQRYCARCHVFHDDIWPPARRWWVAHPDEQLPIRR